MQPFEPEQLPPKELDWKALIPWVGQANRAIAKLEGLLQSLPNPDIMLSPLVTKEAVLSSKIEGTQAEWADVLRYEAGERVMDDSRQADIREIMNYRRALQLSQRLLRERPLCLNTLLRLHEVLMEGVRGSHGARGHFRTVQNWIGRPGSPVEEAFFIPPSPLNLQEHLNRWEAYWHSESPDPLIQLAIIHAQFEIIHPFVDGNGRVGRMLIPLFLFDKGLLGRPCFYLSAYLEAHRDEYYQGLRDLGQEGSWNRWTEFFLKAVTSQADQMTDSCRQIHELYERLKKQILGSSRSPSAMLILDFIFKRPTFRTSDLAQEKDMPSRPALSKNLGAFKELGILKTLKPGAGRKSEVLVFADLINLVEGRKVF